jgi:16S rRNA (adenine1518-N6/adenine1519-N6)-dimethyltransferase
VGTAILRRFLPRHDLFTRLVVMLQLEVIDRLVAEPSGKGHGLLALERAAYGRARFAFSVPPGAFKPRPKVMSAVVVIDLAPPTYADDELAAAFRLASHALTRPRKTMPNALAPLAGVAELERAGIDPSIRPGTLDLAAWVELGRACNEENHPRTESRT